MDKLKEVREEINAIDKMMAELFSKRMLASETIAKYKHENNLPLVDPVREKEVIENNSQYIEDETIRALYIDFLKETMNLSKQYQAKLNQSLFDNILTVNLKDRSYPIVIEEGILKYANRFINLNRKVLIVTDSGIPTEYVSLIKEQCKTPVIALIKKGEKSKSFKNYELLLKTMLNYGFTRNDCVLSLGGGVVGDLAAFVASTYMRGIDFYNIPTTLLSQVDSSIGGKTAIDLDNVKNVVGTFYQPKAVLIDKSVLKTLKPRLLREGLVEAFKMGITSDKSLVELILNSKSIYSDANDIIFKSLMIKKTLVEKDEKDNSVRHILNFGHTFGHAIESIDTKLYHGECVGIGMLYTSSKEVQEVINKFLNEYHLPYKTDIPYEKLLEKIKNDKKSDGECVDIVYVKSIGVTEIKKINIKDLAGGNLCEMF